MFAGAVLVAALAIVLDIVLGGLGLLVGRRARPKRKIMAGTVPVPA
jgi:hypothetical protein